MITIKLPKLFNVFRAPVNTQKIRSDIHVTFDYGNDYQNIKSGEYIGLKDALRLVDTMPTEEEYNRAYLSFMKSNKIIQFIRLKKNNWLFDVPIVTNGKYAKSLQRNIDTSGVKEIVTEFYKNP